VAEIVRLKNKKTGAETRVGRAWLKRFPDDFPQKDWEEIADKPGSSTLDPQTTETAAADNKK
jgi:hypothetical protein